EPTTASGQLTSRELLRPKRAARRAQSFDRAAGAAGGHCLACHTANLGHARHLRSGDCVGFPGSSFYRRQEAPAPEPAQPLPALQEPTEAQTLDDKAADDATKLTPPSSYNSAYDGTAYGNELSDAIQSLTSVVEGLSTTVKNLQESVERLSGRVEQVEFEWAFRQSVQVQDEFPDSNTAPHQAEHYQLSASGTPRSAAGRRSDPDPSAEWYDAPARDQGPIFGAGNVADDLLAITEGQGARQPQELPPQPSTAPTARLPLQ
ncbi:unnamed protein product, partial [Prorocentrum cordatum]